MICVFCGTPVNDIYKEYSKGNIVLTKCSRCGKLVDPYVEHEFILLLLDLILHKRPIYRHLLFNRMEYYDRWLKPQLLVLAIAYIFFDVYAKWLSQLKEGSRSYDFIYTEGIVPFHQYFLYAVLAVLEFLVLLGAVFLGCKVYLWLRGSRTVLVKYNYLVMAVIIASFGKLFYILPLIWEYPKSFINLITLFTISSNIMAVHSFLESEAWVAAAIVFSAWAIKSSAGWMMCRLLGI